MHEEATFHSFWLIGVVIVINKSCQLNNIGIQIITVRIAYNENNWIEIWSNIIYFLVHCNVVISYILKMRSI